MTNRPAASSVPATVSSNSLAVPSSSSSSSSPSTPSARNRIKKPEEEDDYSMTAKDEDGGNDGCSKQRKSTSDSPNVSRDSLATPSSAQKRLHVWTDHQVILLLRAAVALKIDSNSTGWGKMTGYYSQMVKMLREAPDASEVWGPDYETSLTVSKVRSKFESVILYLGSNKYRVRSKDPKVREELQELYEKLRAIQASRVVVSPHEAQKRWKDELEKLRQLWVATKKTDLPKARAQAALKVIRDLKKIRPQLDIDGNCVFPDTVLFDGKVSGEIAAQAQAAVVLAKNSSGSLVGVDSMSPGGDENEDQSSEEEIVVPQEDSDSKQTEIAPGISINTSQLIGTDESDHINDDGNKKAKIVAEVLSHSFEPQKKRRHTETASTTTTTSSSSSSSTAAESSLPSEETCKELSALLKQVIDYQRSSGFCNDCDESGQRCNCRFSRSELLGTLCFTDPCPACHHPICHHP